MRKSSFLAAFTLLFIFSFFVPSFSQFPASASSTLRGDIDENGKIDIFDLLELLKTLGNPAGKTDRQKQIADLNASGSVDIFDLLGLLKALSGSEQPGVIYWGPVITGLSQAGAAAGDTIGIVVENLGENVTAKDIKVYIGMYETGVLELSRYTVKIVVPQAFTGGEVKLVIAADTTNTKYLSLLIRKMIVAASGGLVEHPCGASVDVKAGALNADMQISVSKMSVETAKEQGILEDTCEVPVEFGPSGTVFSLPVTVALPMPSDIDSTDILEAVYYSESKKDWVNLPFIRKDYDKKLLFIETDHFSVMKARKWSIKTEVVQGIAFVSIPGGTFQMGQSGVAVPVHQVTVSAFQMGRYEITQAQYQAVVGSNPSSFTGDLNRPVETVSWYDAVTYCNKLSEAAGLQPCYNSTTWACDFTKNGYRLPTGAEWECACRAGTTTNYYTGDLESDLTIAGWYSGNSGGTTHTVGGKQANAFGLYDMHGNVWEWCNDWWGSYGSGNATDPQGPSSGSDRVVRGGGWRIALGVGGQDCVSAFRTNIPPDHKYDLLGFRVVRREFTPAATHTLQGSILESGSGLSAVTVHVIGAGFNITLTTGSGGGYSLSGLADGIYTVIPIKSGYTFSPASLQVAVSGSDVTAGGITATASGGTVTPADTTVVQGIFFDSIPGGTFQMGSPAGSHEQPVHSVTVSAFQMGRYEITQAQYQAVVGSNPSSFTGDSQRPVEMVIWYDAVTFCNKLSEAAGLQPCYNLTTWACDFTKNGYRLPTEAEWEYACRAGTITYYYTGDDESDLAKAGWYVRNSGNTTHTVGGKQANAFGLYDMHGNVWEWCNDWYGSYSSGNATDPQGPSSGSDRVVRGGSWDSGPGPANGDCRSSYRDGRYPVGGNPDVGFRVVRR